MRSTLADDRIGYEIMTDCRSKYRQIIGSTPHGFEIIGSIDHTLDRSYVRQVIRWKTVG